MKEETIKKEPIFIRKPWVKSLVALVGIFLILGVFVYWQMTKNTVYIENSTLVAPIVNLASSSSGTLNALYVKNGDVIAPNTVVALVGTTAVTSREAGIVVGSPDALGGYYVPGMTIVSVIKIDSMKVVGTVDETGGLAYLSVGQRADFTVDAFGSKVYQGFVDEISPTSSETGVTFSISDKRPVQKYDVSVRFDVSQYPELKNGMSAKITVHTK